MINKEENRTCPACGEMMTKIFVAEKGINIDICTESCGGIFFDNKELNQFNSDNENSEILETLKNKNFMPIDETIIRVCPECGTNMAKTNIGGPSGIQIDSCYCCGGIFLDNGELETLRSRLKTKPKTTYNAEASIGIEEETDFTLKEFYKEAVSEENASANSWRFWNFLSFLNRRYYY